MNARRVMLICFVLLIGLGLGTAALASPIALEQSPIVLADSTPAATKTPKPEKSLDADDSANNQRVPEAIGKYFGVTASDLLTLHQAGKGWGEIVKAYTLAQASKVSIAEIFAMRAQEQGWGGIAKTLAVGKWNTNLGAIMRDTAAKKNSGDDAPGNSGAHRNNDKNKSKLDDKGKPDDIGKNK